MDRLLFAREVSYRALVSRVRHVEIVKWLREQGDGQDDQSAASLAQDFYAWTDGDAKRREVLQLFQLEEVY